MTDQPPRPGDDRTSFTDTAKRPAPDGFATWHLHIRVTAPNEDNAERWAGHIRDLVVAEFGETTALAVHTGPGTGDARGDLFAALDYGDGRIQSQLRANALIAARDAEHAHELAERQRREMHAPGRSYDASRWNRCVDMTADLIDPEAQQ